MKRVCLGLLLSASVAGATSPTDPCAAPDVASSASQAQSLAHQKKFVAAEAPANAALKACPTHGVAAGALGESLVGQKRFDDAVNRMSAVLASKPDVAPAYLWRGYAFYSKHQTDRMVSDFQMFLKLAPNAPEAAAVKQLLAGMQK